VPQNKVNIPRHIQLILNLQSVLCATLLDLTGGLDRVVLEVTVRALETFQNDVAEVGHADEKEAGGSGYRLALSMICELCLGDEPLFMAV
jgi:hypothetical protein